jgi:hypothetical protein
MTFLLFTTSTHTPTSTLLFLSFSGEIFGEMRFPQNQTSCISPKELQIIYSKSLFTMKRRKARLASISSAFLASRVKSLTIEFDQNILSPANK